MKKTKWQILLCITLALLIAMGATVPTNALADEEAAETLLTITGLELPKAGSVFPKEATVVSEEGVSWQIPVLWIDETGVRSPDIAGDGLCYPVFVLFIPDEAAMHRQNAEAEDFRLTVDEAILALFGGKINTVFDADTGLTYIIPGNINFTPPKAVPAYGPLGSEQEKENATYRNPNYIKPDAEEETPYGDKTEAETVSAPDKDSDHAEVSDQAAMTRKSGEAAMYPPAVEESDSASASPEKEPVQESNSAPAFPEKESVPQEDRLPLDIIPVHCAKTAQNALEPEELASLVDLIRYKLQPQAVNILLDRFPAFREAYDEGLIGQNLGLYIYAFSGDKDGIEPHQNIKENWTAFVRSRLYDYTDYCYMMCVNVRYFFEVNERNTYVKDKETGKYILTEDEQRIQNMESTIIHEMLHLFMHDYNRVGMTGTTDPEMWGDPELSKADRAELYKSKFPTWFTEGLACSVQNTYQYRNFAFQRLRYLGDGEYDPYYTPENVLSAYQMTKFQAKRSSKEFISHFDLETADDKNVKDKVDAQYTSGYLACLYLAELAANQKGTSSITTDEAGDFIVKSDPLREGVNTILERLHKGETLDELIENLSGGRFADTAAFERAFIKGDGDSLDFCVTYLNYMQELSEEPDREYLPSGSILLDFDLDYSSPLDRNMQGAENAFVFTDSNTVVPSTVELLRAYTNGGTSYRGLFREEDFADIENQADEDIFPEEEPMDEDEENTSDAAFDDESLPRDEADDPEPETIEAFEEEDAPVQAFEFYTEETTSYEGDSDFQDDWGGGWDDGE